jgi:hypothetical protein
MGSHLSGYNRHTASKKRLNRNPAGFVLLKKGIKQSIRYLVS